MRGSHVQRHERLIDGLDLGEQFLGGAQRASCWERGGGPRRLRWRLLLNGPHSRLLQELSRLLEKQSLAQGVTATLALRLSRPKRLLNLIR